MDKYHRAMLKVITKLLYLKKSIYVSTRIIVKLNLLYGVAHNFSRLDTGNARKVDTFL